MSKSNYIYGCIYYSLSDIAFIEFPLIVEVGERSGKPLRALIMQQPLIMQALISFRVFFDLERRWKTITATNYATATDYAGINFLSNLYFDLRETLSIRGFILP